MEWMWVILVIVALVVVSKLIHFKHFKHKIFSIIVILVLAFLFFSFTTIVKNHSIDLKTASGVFSASKVYFSWLVHSFGNIKEISGNVVRMDWIPKNNSGTTGSAISDDSWSSSDSSSSEDGW